MAGRIEHRPSTFAALCAILALSACTIVPVEEDRAMRERRANDFDAAGHVARYWAGTFLPGLESAAVELNALAPAMRADLAKAGVANGRRASEGANWTFVIKGSGTVTAVDRGNPVGTVSIDADGAGPVRLLTGPVLVTTAIRDSIPTIRFDDFGDQMAFASVNKALNDMALQGVGKALAGLAPGERIEFTGALAMPSAGAALEIVPLRIAATGRGNAS